MGKANRLSKRLNWKVEVENDNKNQKLIKEKQVRGLGEVVVEEPEMELLKNKDKSKE